MEFKFEYDEEIINKALDRLQNVSKTILDKLDIETKVGRVISEAGAKQIKSHGTYGGTLYDPLKSKKDEGRAPLINTGTMFDAVMRAKVNSRFKGSRKEFEIGIDNEYASLHQKGTKNMPARPILVVTQEEKEEISRIVFSKVVENIGKKI